MNRPIFWRLAFFYPSQISRSPKMGSFTPPLPFPYTGCHQTASYSLKMAPLHFCTSGSEMPLTEEPGLYKRRCLRSPSHSVSTTNTLSGALCLRPLPSASRMSLSMEMHRERHMVNLWSGIELVLFTMRGCCQQFIYICGRHSSACSASAIYICLFHHR
jgi:hypothetical protein